MKPPMIVNGFVLALALMTLLISAGPAAASAGSEMPQPEPCALRVWQEYAADIWFHDERGERIVPNVEYGWILVRFAPTQEMSMTPITGRESPPVFIQTFNERYKEFFTQYLSNLSPDCCLYAYKLTEGLPAASLSAFLGQVNNFPGVRYVHPALRIADALYATLDEIQVEWKTATDGEQRRRILSGLHALSSSSRMAAGPETVKIDICEMPVWKAADLLAEDIHVAAAWPVLIPLRPPVSCRMTLAVNGANVGTPIPFELKIEFLDEFRIEPGSIASLSLKPPTLFRDLFDIVFDKPLSSMKVANSPVLLTGRLIIYAPGEYQIPPLQIHYRSVNDEGATPRIVKTREIPIRIASLIPEEPGEYRLQTGDPIPGPGWEGTAVGERKSVALNKILASATLLAACLALLVYLLTRRGERPHGNVTEDSREKARRELLSRIETKPERIGVTDLAGLGRAVRNYLAEAYGLSPDHAGGSRTVFLQEIGGRLPESAKASLHRLLGQVEDTMAVGHVDAQEARQCYTAALSIVQEIERDTAASSPTPP